MAGLAGLARLAGMTPVVYYAPTADASGAPNRSYNGAPESQPTFALGAVLAPPWAPTVPQARGREPLQAHLLLLASARARDTLTSQAIAFIRPFVLQTIAGFHITCDALCNVKLRHRISDASTAKKTFHL